MPPPQTASPDNIQTPAGCAPLPSLDTLSTPAKQELMKALTYSGIVDRLTSVDPKLASTSEVLEAGLRAISICDPRFKDLLPGFHSLIRGSTALNEVSPEPASHMESAFAQHATHQAAFPTKDSDLSSTKKKTEELV